MDRMLKLSDDEKHSCASKSRRASHNQLVQNRNPLEELDSIRLSALDVGSSKSSTLTEQQSRGSADLISSRSIDRCRRARRSAAADLPNDRSNVVRRALYSSARKAVVTGIKQHRAASAMNQAALAQHHYYITSESFLFAATHQWLIIPT
ncbi:hypothetical protein ACLKA6_001129 [Drosophila palustris]